VKLLLKHERGELGPYTVEEWNRPNGGDCLLIYMLKTIEQNGGERVELIAVKEADFSPDYMEELRV
jgi:hypothetical protein